MKTNCQLWFNGTDKPVISKVLEYKFIWKKEWGNNKTGIFQPYLMACRLPKSHRDQVPLSVSIVENICDKPTNNLRVIYNKLPEDETDKKEFAVCVKGLDFPNDDLSVRLIEWIELLHILGADKIFFYNLEVHPNVTKVLNYYEDKSYIDITPISLPGMRLVTLTLYSLALKLIVLLFRISLKKSSHHMSIVHACSIYISDLYFRLSAKHSWVTAFIFKREKK